MIHKTQQPFLTLHYNGILISFIRSTKQHTTTHKFKESIMHPTWGEPHSNAKRKFDQAHTQVYNSHTHTYIMSFSNLLFVFQSASPDRFPICSYKDLQNIFVVTSVGLLSHFRLQHRIPIEHYSLQFHNGWILCIKKHWRTCLNGCCVLRIKLLFLWRLWMCQFSYSNLATKV